jgi:hypothetical protein
LKGNDNPIQIISSGKIFSEAEIRTAACQSLQPMWLQFLILPFSGKSKMEDYPKKAKFEFFYVLGV